MKSVHVVPPFVVLQTWPAPPVKPMMPTYAVFPVPSDRSAATLEMGNWFGLMLPSGPFSVTSAKPKTPVDASVVIHTRPPAGVVSGPWMGPSPLVVA